MSSDCCCVGFAVEFEFLPNEYFANVVLTKTYIYGPVPSDPFLEPSLVSIESSPVEWKGGHDLTAIRSGARQKPTSSFFCLFSKGGQYIMHVFV